MNIDLNLFLIVSSMLFAIGFFCILLRKNTLIIFMGLEIMLVASNIALVAFSKFNNLIEGAVFAFFIMTIAAAEVAIGLAIIVTLYRWTNTVKINQMNTLKD